MHATCLLVLLYIPTKYYQNMSKGIKVKERTRMRLRTDGHHADHYTSPPPPPLPPEPISWGIKNDIRLNLTFLMGRSKIFYMDCLGKTLKNVLGLIKIVQIIVLGSIMAPPQGSLAGLGGSVGCAIRLETRRSRVQPLSRSATFFRGD